MVSAQFLRMMEAEEAKKSAKPRKLETPAPKAAKPTVDKKPKKDIKELRKAVETLEKTASTTLPKKAISIRLDVDVIEGFKAGGAGWMSQMNAVLRKSLNL